MEAKKKFFLLDMNVVPNTEKKYDLGTSTNEMVDKYFVGNLMLDEYDVTSLIRKSYDDGTIAEGSYDAVCKNITPINKRVIQEHTAKDFHVIRYYDRTLLHFDIDINKVWYTKSSKFILIDKPYICSNYRFDSLKQAIDFIETKDRVIINHFHVNENHKIDIIMAVLKMADLKIN